LIGAWGERHIPRTQYLGRVRAIPRAAAAELGEPDVVALRRREPEQLVLAVGEEDVDGDLQVGAVPGLQRPGDDRQLGGVGAEVVGEAPAGLGLGLGRVRLGPRGEPLDRVGELLGFHVPMLAPGCGGGNPSHPNFTPPG
jgi:hypothetical protein